MANSIRYHGTQSLQSSGSIAGVAGFFGKRVVVLLSCFGRIQTYGSFGS